MRLQCTVCGFTGVFAGGGIAPKACPACTTGLLSQPVAMSSCPHCGGAYAAQGRTCPHCGVERVKQSMDRERGTLPIPDGSPPPRRK